jgi:CxxC motif-containing protein
MSEKMVLICITCPKGCNLRSHREGTTILKVDSGCKRGILYAEEERSAPHGCHYGAHPGGFTPAAAGRHRRALPKTKDTGAPVNAPVKMGDVVLANALDTGIDIIASRSM